MLTIYECFEHIDQNGRALDEFYNEFRDDEGACVYVPRKLWGNYNQVIIEGV
jgi:hypothetical protein